MSGESLSGEVAEPWLDIIGIGEDGVAGLSPAALERLEAAEILIGGDRHHRLTEKVAAARLSWPSPFDAMIDEIHRHKGRRIVILVTGDPLWYSVGARIARAIPADEIRFYPQLSAFQWAACRLGWSLADCETLTVHGRPAEQIVPYFAPGARLLVLTRDGGSPAEVAALLTARGFGESRLTVLSALGGAAEQRFDGVAESWNRNVPDFHTLAIECVAGPDAAHFSRQSGLSDDAFRHDGQITKRVVRAATMAALAPYPDALLWDIGAGCGSVSIEWMRAVRGARAIAIEPAARRRAMIAENAKRLGTPKLEVIAGSAPAALGGLAAPDAVFIGGGLTAEGVFETAFSALRPGGMLVANAVTLESQARLTALYREHGGRLETISVSEAAPVGGFAAMRPAMAVTQWTLRKPFGAGG